MILDANVNNKCWDKEGIIQILQHPSFQHTRHSWCNYISHDASVQPTSRRSSLLTNFAINRDNDTCKCGQRGNRHLRDFRQGSDEPSLERLFLQQFWTSIEAQLDAKTTLCHHKRQAKLNVTNNSERADGSSQTDDPAVRWPYPDRIEEPDQDPTYPTLQAKKYKAKQKSAAAAATAAGTEVSKPKKIIHLSP